MTDETKTLFSREYKLASAAADADGRERECAEARLDVRTPNGVPRLSSELSF